MKPESAESKAVSASVKASPPNKKARTADFSAVVKRSHSITESSLKEIMGVKKFKGKIINDCIHGHIRLPPVAVAIIDTPQFQRLRFLKQVGGCHFVYPNAIHNRFQHSLGVGHLAYKLADRFRRENSLISEKDVVCVMLAGLCHDLGHGPFSHFWEGFVNKANPSLNWCHEDSSIRMLDYLIEDNNLMPVLAELGDINAQDIVFIKEAIAGPLDERSGMPLRDFQGQDHQKTWPYRGRPVEKGFLYEIVANKISGIDVDKWDYLLRDSKYLNVDVRFKHERFMECCKIKKFNGRPRICLRDKEYRLVLEMYEDRATLHEKGYQHRVTKTVDRMMLDAFILAEKHIKVKGSQGRYYTLAEAGQDVKAYMKLTDDVFHRVYDSEDEHPEMLMASNIMKRIMTRDFYKNIATINCFETHTCCPNCDDCRKKSHPCRGKSPNVVEQELKSFILEQNQELDPEEIVVVRAKATMGMGNRDPIHRVPFYTKDDEEVTDVSSMSISAHMGPSANFEYFHILCKSPDEAMISKFAAVTKLFQDKNNYH